MSRWIRRDIRRGKQEIAGDTPAATVRLQICREAEKSGRE